MTILVFSDVLGCGIGIMTTDYHVADSFDSLGLLAAKYDNFGIL
jgi:hypothetical protein